MNWNIFFLTVEVVLYPLLGLLFLFGMIRLFLGLRQLQHGSASERQNAWYDYPAALQGIQAMLLALFGGCFLTESHISDFFLKILLGTVGLVCGFFYALSLSKLRTYASYRRNRLRKKREAQPKEIFPLHDDLPSQKK